MVGSLNGHMLPGEWVLCVREPGSLLLFPFGLFFRPSLRILDFVEDLRLVAESGGRTRLFWLAARFIDPLSELRVRFYTRESNRRWPCRSIQCLGSDVEACPSKGEEVRER